MRNYDKLLAAGNAAQLEKLKRDSHKPPFETMDVEEAFGLMRQETHEVFTELYSSREIDYTALRSEFADVANFAHIGILACDREMNN